MNRRLVFLLALLPIVALAAPPSQEVLFVSGRLEHLQDVAAKEGKPLFVHFTANWCMPCQWMEKSVYTDSHLAAFLNQHFLAVKIDIDDVNSREAVNRYQVTVLPTILVFSASGEILARKEEAFPADRLLSCLRNVYQTDEPPPGHPQPAHSSSSDPFFRPALLPEPPSSPPATATPKPLLTASSLPSSTTSYAEAPRSKYGFTIQVGVFSHFENASRQKKFLETHFDLPVSISEGTYKGEKAFIIQIGRFFAESEANAYLDYLKKFGVKGMVKGG